MQGTRGHCISLVLYVEELDGQISVQVDDCTVVHEVVEVLLLQVALSLHDQVLREDIWSIGALEQRMLTVALQVPCDDEEAPIHVIDNEELDQIFNTSRVNVLDPDFCTRIDIKVDCVR